MPTSENETTVISTSKSTKHEDKIDSIGNTLKSKTKHKHHGRHCHHARKHHRRCRHRVRSHPISGTPLKVIIPNRPAPVETKDAEVKGNIPLQSVENTIKSQRPTSTDETQVGNYATFVDSCCAPQVQQVCYEDSCCTPQIQQVCYEDSCCLPSNCANTCVSETKSIR